MACLSNLSQGSYKVIETAEFVRSCDFLSVCHCKHNSVLFSTLKNNVTLKSTLGFTKGHWKSHHAVDCLRVSIRLPYGPILYRIWDKAIYWSKSRFLYSPFYTTIPCENKYFKSFKVTRGHSKWHCWVGRESLLEFYCKYMYVYISYRFWDIQRQRMAWPWNCGYGSFKVTENGARRYIIYDFLLVGHCKYSSVVPFTSNMMFSNRHLEKGHSRSFKLVPFESLDAVSYSPSIVKYGRRPTVSFNCSIGLHIFSVKE